MEIKRGTTPVLAVRIGELDADAQVQSVEFIFKQECSESAQVLVRKRWPGEAQRTERGVYRVPLTACRFRGRRQEGFRRGGTCLWTQESVWREEPSRRGR